jgi:hypothetical protein
MNHRQALVSRLVHDRRVVGAVLLRLGHETRAQRVARELGRGESGFLRDALDDDRHREVGEALVADVLVPIDRPEHRAFPNLSELEPVLQRAHGARCRVTAVRDDLRKSFAFLIGLAAPHERIGRTKTSAQWPPASRRVDVRIRLPAAPARRSTDCHEQTSDVTTATVSHHLLECRRAVRIGRTKTSAPVAPRLAADREVRARAPVRARTRRTRTSPRRSRPISG